MAKVYVLYTGGTIGCEPDSQGALAPIPGPAFERLVLSMPGLSGHTVADHPELGWTMGWLDRTLDSAAMTPADWLLIAQRILDVYGDYDGFVVLHGTDTMAYTASALSFLLPGLSKPVILGGSQVPLSFTLSDALPNLVGALVLAGTLELPEVCVYFDTLLLRGNRARKVDANRFAGFGSPNFPPLATVGSFVAANRALWLPMPEEDFSLAVPANLAARKRALATKATALAEFSVAMLWLHPGLRASTVKAVLAGTTPPVKGLVLLAFGEGNGPTDPEFLAALSDANRKGVIVMDNTQAQGGSVLPGAYATGLGAVGAVGAYDLTPEASFAKLVCLIASGLGPDAVKALMAEALAGELTVGGA
ncbi:asparaginase domain-containing protein [Azospirillum doebereinerae]|uniref:Asparaginase n=1 Tax=Azospirillum doebereinerae TaxID=92933 RepID=A0A433IZV2_9PROT|nr:asparaginase domain-containing protein [Azospirillum doebereinerae]MCG5242248.1 asparaginase domain-containing protein [Azospirillum doebereinerae]RUQ61434.1 asparaginase [Azospirillum doebereinerae]